MVGQPFDETGHSTGVDGSGPTGGSDGTKQEGEIACDGGNSELRRESDDIDEVVTELFGDRDRTDGDTTERDPETDTLLDRLSKDELTVADRIELREGILELEDRATDQEELRRDVRAIATAQRAIEEDLQAVTDRLRTLERELDELDAGRARESDRR
jgi:hypothetical protein